MLTIKDFADALKSGKYKQARKVLRRGDCFCVSGVLCDLLKIPYDDGGYVSYGGELCIYCPPGQVYSWAKDNAIDIWKMINDNDDQISFSHIADRLLNGDYNRA